MLQMTGGGFFPTVLVTVSLAFLLALAKPSAYVGCIQNVWTNGEAGNFQNAPRDRISHRNPQLPHISVKIKYHLVWCESAQWTASKAPLTSPLYMWNNGKLLLCSFFVMTQRVKYWTKTHLAWDVKCWPAAQAEGKVLERSEHFLFLGGEERLYERCDSDASWELYKERSVFSWSLTLTRSQNSGYFVLSWIEFHRPFFFLLSISLPARLQNFMEALQ